MRDSRPFFALRTYALAFAVALSPAFLQADCARGNTELSSLELEVDGGPNLIVGFDTDNRSYDVSTSGSTVTVRAQAVYAVNDVSWQWLVGTTTIGSGPIGTGGGELTIPIPIPDGQSVLRVAVKSNEVGATASGYYAINLSGGGWGTAELLSDSQGDYIAFPEVALDVQGNAVAVWQISNRIWSSRYTPVAGWSAPELIENDTGGSLSPRVAMDVQGNAIAVWYQGSGGRYDIWSNRYVAGVGWGTPELIEGDGLNTAVLPEIAVNAQGQAVVVWDQSDGTYRNIWANRYTPGAGWGTAELIETNDLESAFHQQVAIDPAGNAIAVWEQDHGSLHHVWANRSPSTGGWEGGVRLEDADPAYSSRPSIAMDAQGNAVVAWQFWNGPGTTWHVWANRYTPGAGWGSSVEIESNDSGDPFFVQVAIDAQGNPMAVWQQSDGTYDSIWSNRYTAGAGWGTPELVETNDAGNASFPQVSMIGVDHAVAVWEQSNGTRKDIWFNLYTPTGGWGTAAPIESNDDNDDVYPEIATDTRGNAMVVWQHGDGTEAQVWANHYVGSVDAAVRISVEGDVTARPDVVIQSDGFAQVVWEKEHGALRITHYAFYRPSYGWIVPFSLGAGGVDPRMASDPNGNLVVAWAAVNDWVWGTGYTDNVWQYWEALSNGGAPSKPQAAIDWNGNGIAIWGKYDVYANRYSPISGWNAFLSTWNLRPVGGDPQIGMDAHGNAIAVWRTTADSDLQANRYSPEDGWGDPGNISGFFADALEHQVSMDPNGNAGVAWTTGTLVYLNYFEASTGAWRGISTPMLTPTPVSQPQVALDGAGNALLLWTQAGEVWMSEFRPASNLWTSSARIDGDVGPASDSRIARDRVGNAIVVWRVWSGSQYALWANVFYRGGGWETPFLVHHGSTDANDHEVAINNEGEAMVVWEEGQSIWAKELGIGPPDWKFDCTEQGILDAIQLGGGLHHFKCNGPTTVTTTNEIVIDKDVVLDGEGNLTIDGGGTHRVLSVDAGVTAHLARITVTGGYTDAAGGGIRNNGDLRLSNATVSGNTAEGSGGGIYNASASLTLSNSTVSGNTSVYGGGIYNESDLATATILNSTLSGNVSTGSGCGGGVANLSGVLNVANSTVSDNSAGLGGGICTFDLFGGPSATLIMSHGTVAGNLATGDASAIWNNAVMTLTSSVIQGTCVTDAAPTGSRSNIESPGNTCGFSSLGDNWWSVSSSALNLGPLQDNGGPTLTRAPGVPSDALDRIPRGGAPPCNGVDQRGATRRADYCDVGAVEVVQ